jgi:hypothetical protein
LYIKTKIQKIDFTLILKMTNIMNGKIHSRIFVNLLQIRL